MIDDPLSRLAEDPEMQAAFAQVAAEHSIDIPTSFIYVRMTPEYANGLLDCWNHIVDHQCEAAYDVFAEFNSRVIEIIVEEMGGDE